MGEEALSAYLQIERGLHVVATRSPPPRELATTLLSGSGGFGVAEYRSTGWTGTERTRDGRSGTLLVRGDLPVHVSACLRSAVLATVRLAEPPEKLEIAIPVEAVLESLATLTFRLTVPGRDAPPEEVSLSLSDRQSMTQTKFERDGDRFTVRHAVPGELQLRIAAAGDLETHVRNVLLAPGRTLDLGTIRLAKAVLLSGRVVDAAGEPVGGAQVTSYDLERPWAEQRGTPFLETTDHRGAFRLRLGPRRYAIGVAARGKARTVVEADLTAGFSDEIVVRLPECGKLRLVTSGEAAYPKFLCIEDAAGRVIYGITLLGAWPRDIHLPPGDYRLRVRQPDRRETTRDFTVNLGPNPDLAVP
jgi:hypothetical protein